MAREAWRQQQPDEWTMPDNFYVVHLAHGLILCFDDALGSVITRWLTKPAREWDGTDFALCVVDVTGVQCWLMRQHVAFAGNSTPQSRARDRKLNDVLFSSGADDDDSDSWRDSTG